MAYTYPPYPLWPQTLPPSEVMFHPTAASRSGGRTIVGTEQVVQAGAGYWTATVKFDVYRKPGMVGGANKEVAYRAMLGYLQGRANPILIGPSTLRTSPALVAGQPLFPRYVPHSDGSTFSDGSQYRMSLTPAKMSGNAPTGATVLNLSMSAGHQPQPGQYFSVVDRLYLINTAALVSGNVNFGDLGPWSGTAAMATAVAGAPDLSSLAYDLTDSDAASIQYRASAVYTVPNDSTAHTVVVYIRKNAAAPTPGINLFLTGGTPVTTAARLNMATGATSNCTAVDSGTGWWIVTATVTNNSSGNMSLQVFFYPATAANNVISDSNAATGTNRFALATLAGAWIWTVNFWPPVREQLGDQSPVEFDSPVCRMRLSVDTTGQLNMQQQKYGAPSIELVEATM